MCERFLAQEPLAAVVAPEAPVKGSVKKKDKLDKDDAIQEVEDLRFPEEEARGEMVHYVVHVCYGVIPPCAIAKVFGSRKQPCLYRSEREVIQRDLLGLGDTA